MLLNEHDIREIVKKCIFKYLKEQKEKLTILWLDDRRNPEKYFLKKADSYNACLTRNFSYYNNLKNINDIDFIWVKNFQEFSNFILKNGLPKFISFDYDLGKGEPKGKDCAQWLINYCKENSLSVPKFYIHSANLNAEKEINSILSEGVYVNNVKGNKANLSYLKNTNWHKGNLMPQDKVDTTYMDSLDEKTIEIPLKCGIMSYNITDINGDKVMQYFKHYWEHQKTLITLKTQEKNGEIVNNDYELQMETKEFNDFLFQFIKKVNRVVEYNLMRYKWNDIEFSKVSIYPVPSSSNFNINIANKLIGMNLGGLPIQVINENLLIKDLSILEKDTDFIKKNKKFYNSKMSNSLNDYSVNDYLTKDIERSKALQKVEPYIEEINKYAKKILICYNNYKNLTQSETTLQNLVKYYQNYCISIANCLNNCHYFNPLSNNKDSSFFIDSLAKKLKYSKGPSISLRTDKIWDLIKPYLRGQINPITHRPFVKTEIVFYEKKDFQMKNLSNPERMGLKNFFRPNKDEELLQQELEKIKNSVLVIFDDNISGGSTLSDICSQCYKLGIKHIIPITFGKMREKNNLGHYGIINRPINSVGQEGYNY